MKNTLMKVWGIILTVAILSGLLMATVPVSAATSTDVWTQGKGPVVTMQTAANIYTVANDGTIYLWTTKIASLSQAITVASTKITVNSTEGFPESGTIAIGGTDIAYTSKTDTTFTVAAGVAAAAKDEVSGGTGTVAAALYKSIDDGKSWTVVASGNKTSTKMTTWVPDSAMISYIKVCPTDATQLIAFDGTSIFRSTNGGKTWNSGSVAADIDSSATIFSVDIAEGANDIAIVAGTDKGVYLYDTNDMNWTKLGTLPGDVYGIALSPDYASDGLVIAAAGDPLTINYWDSDAAVWNDYLKAVELNVSGIINISFGFGNDFSYDNGNRFFLGINATTGSGLWRVIGKTTVSEAKNTHESAEVTSVVVNGTSKSNTITVGLADGTIEYSTDADTAATEFTWLSVSDETSGIVNPIGTNANVQMIDGIYYAGTDGTNNGFFKAADGKAFKGIAFDEVNNVYTCGITNYGAFAWVRDDFTAPDSSYQLFKNTPDGWMMVLSSPTGAGNPSGAFGSKTMMFAPAKFMALPATKVLFKTDDGGDTWYTINTPGRKVPSMLKVIDDTNYWIGYAGNIMKNNGTTYQFANNTETPGSIDFMGDNGILVKTSPDGINLTNYYYSNDSGANWHVIGASGKYSGAPTTFDAASKTIYVVNATNDVYKWVLDVSTDWELTSLGSTLDIVGISLINGAYYIRVNPASTADPQIYRSVDTIVADYRPLFASSKAAVGGTMLFFFGFPGADGSTTIGTTVLGDSSLKAFNYANTIDLTYTDSLIKPLSLIAPADAVQINSPTDFSWTATSYAKGGSYRLEAAYDKAFLMKVTGYPVYTTNTTVLNAAFATGTTYYWRARLESAGDYAAPYDQINGKWSEVRSFTIKTMGTTTFGLDDPNSVYPARGQTAVSTLPVLTWGIVPGAVYNIKIATDSAFTNIVDSKDGLTVAVYTPAKSLDINKTYYWEVQAVAGGIASDWVAFAFTTAGATQVTTTTPAAPPTSTVTFTMPTPTISIPSITVPTAVVTVTNVPSDTNTKTPAWAWIVIAIGAVLVIAVIVLIVRTRKV